MSNTFLLDNKQVNLSELDPSLFEFEQKDVLFEDEKIVTKPYSYWGSFGKTLIKSKLFVISFIAMFVITLLSFVLSSKENIVDESIYSTKPTWDHIFGIGKDGDDFFITMWIGIWGTIKFAFQILLVELIFSYLFGIMWGYHLLPDSAMNAIYKIYSFIPKIVIWICIVFLIYINDLDNGSYYISFWIGATSWVKSSKEIKDSIRKIKRSNLIYSLKLVRWSEGKIFFKAIAPNTMPTIFKYFSLVIPEAIVIDSSLAFFREGVVESTNVHRTTLGNIISNAILDNSWIENIQFVIIPVIVIAILSLVYYLVGRELVRSSDSRSHKHL